MGEMFEEFKIASTDLIEDALKEAPKKMERYVRKTLDLEQHRANYSKWNNREESEKNLINFERNTYLILHFGNCTGEC